MTLPTDPQAIAERCWSEAMAWLFREAYIVRPEVSELRELYTGIVNGTEDDRRLCRKVGAIVTDVYSATSDEAPFLETVTDPTAVAMLQVIARGKP